MFPQSWAPVVPQILIGLTNKNPEFDIGAKDERSEKQGTQPLVLTSTKSSDRMGCPVSTVLTLNAVS